MLKTIAPPPFVAPSAAPAAPAPARAAVAPTPANAPAAHPFARMLKQNQAPHAEAPARKAESPARTDDDAATVDAENADAAGTPARTDGRGRARGRTDERSTARTPQAVGKAVDIPTPIGETKASESDEAKPATTADPAFAAWLAERPLAPDAIPRDARVPSADADTPKLGNADATPTRPASAQPLDPSGPADAKRTDPDAKADAKAFTDLMAQRVAIEPPGLTIAAERAAADRHADLPSTRLESIAGTPAFSAAAFAPAATTSSLAAPVDVRVATPVGAPDFAQALGTQVSVLAGNGVQRAELHLNPAEMGPVSVQIVVENGQARVDFGADVAATRQAIENGLPELASALRDAGLTLTGGGVSQHARGRGEHGAQGGPNRGRGERAGSDAAPVAAVRARQVAVGGVDLYA